MLSVSPGCRTMDLPLTPIRHRPQGSVYGGDGCLAQGAQGDGGGKAINPLFNQVRKFIEIKKSLL